MTNCAREDVEKGKHSSIAGDNATCTATEGQQVVRQFQYWKWAVFNRVLWSKGYIGIPK